MHSTVQLRFFAAERARTLCSQYLMIAFMVCDLTIGWEEDDFDRSLSSMRTNKTARTTTLLVVATLMAVACVVNMSARQSDSVRYPLGYRTWVHDAALYGFAAGDTVEYPLGYRTWVHVRSAFINPGSPAAERYGGLHHIYANEKALEGYRTGQFPDGSIIVFDLLETRESAGTTAEGPRKLIDVMTRQSQRYPETGGWAFEEFTGDSQTARGLTAQEKKGCFDCHAARKNHDYVFSTFRK